MMTAMASRTPNCHPMTTSMKARRVMTMQATVTKRYKDSNTLPVNKKTPAAAHTVEMTHMCRVDMTSSRCVSARTNTRLVTYPLCSDVGANFSLSLAYVSHSCPYSAAREAAMSLGTSHLKPTRVHLMEPSAAMPTSSAHEGWSRRKALTWRGRSAAGTGKDSLFLLSHRMKTSIQQLMWLTRSRFIAPPCRLGRHMSNMAFWASGVLRLKEAS
mmetsp:Transcript_9586/g.27635  ORF Transcript_9586/g.27635 Transcript_9586/m.27635 type:complete len:214 (+) Transcript_9586:3393-4034(+)